MTVHVDADGTVIVHASSKGYNPSVMRDLADHAARIYRDVNGMTDTPALVGALEEEDRDHA